MMAALASKTGTVSFVGGMDVPLIRSFACGYVGGAKAANADINVIETMTGTTPEAWNNQTKGAEITKSQIDQGSDVIFQAAGGTGIAVLQTAADAGKLGIGVDSNQNGMHPGSVLTSMLKRVDVAVYNAFMDAKNDSFSYGFNVLGLENDGVGYAMDENNASLVSDEMKATIEAAKADIISGKITVHDYMSDNNCPY
jgi:basic membrane protein A